MNRKIGITSMVCLLLTLNLFSQVKEQKNIAGIGAGFSPARVVWIGNPVNVWADIIPSSIVQVFYARQVLAAVRLGGYLEYENATFKSADEKASRYNFGLNWLAQYPSKPFHAQLGGYFGYGFVKANIWDQSLGGIDYGIMVGPAYEKNNFGIAMHLHSGFSYYTSSGVPDEVSYSKARFLLKAYYKF
jgi:hypothetical protein